MFDISDGLVAAVSDKCLVITRPLRQTMLLRQRTMWREFWCVEGKNQGTMIDSVPPLPIYLSIIAAKHTIPFSLNILLYLIPTPFDLNSQLD